MLAALSGFFVHIVEARRRPSTLNRSRCNRQKQNAKHARMEKETSRKTKLKNLEGFGWG